MNKDEFIVAANKLLENDYPDIATANEEYLTLLKIGLASGLITKATAAVLEEVIPKIEKKQDYEKYENLFYNLLKVTTFYLEGLAS